MSVSGSLKLASNKVSKENINTSATTTLESLKPYSALIHPSSTVHGKLRAVIERKSLRLLDKQRALRASVAGRLTHGTMSPLNHLDFRRVRKPTIHDATHDRTT